MTNLATKLATDCAMRVGWANLKVPTLTSLDVSSGTEAGGTTVTATGTGLTGTTGITVNGVAATGVTVVSPTTVTFVTPAATFALSSTAASNAKDVVLTNPAGSSTLAGGYTYTSEFARILGSNYTAEYRANDPAVTLVSSALSVWPSYGGAGYTLSQGTAANRAAYEATGWNGGPSFLFDGSNDSVLNAAVTGFGNGLRPYVWVVHQNVANAASVNTFQMVSSTGNNGLSLRTNGAGSNWEYGRGDSSGGSSTIGAALNTNKHLYELGFTASGTNAFVEDGTGRNSTTTGAANENITKIAVGSNASGTQNQNVRVVAVIISPDMPSAQNKTDMRAAFKSAMWVGYTSSSLNLP